MQVTIIKLPVRVRARTLPMSSSDEDGYHERQGWIDYSNESHTPRVLFSNTTYYYLSLYQVNKLRMTQFVDQVRQGMFVAGITDQNEVWYILYMSFVLGF